jgi:tRNA-uridine 2-sulfurtransferase
MKISTTKKASLSQNVYVALSGGVDSAVAAALLKEQGCRVTGVFMKNWSGEEFGLEDRCPWKEDQESAEAVCEHLGIPFRTYNFEKEYRRTIISYFFDEYRAGRTPNPDILCNQVIKFGSFLKKALGEGADLIATGHYAGVRKNEDGTYELLRAADREKDQTYFLYRLNQEQLSRTLFPLAHMTKLEVREVASKLHLPNATRKDSQGICFIGKIDVTDFLVKEIQHKQGDIVDIDANQNVGTHAGVWYYTLGQREGLFIGGAGEPYYVCEKDIDRNILYVAKGSDNPALYCKKVVLSDIHWINPARHNTSDLTLTCQVRYRQEPQKCSLSKNVVTFSKPIWIPSPGQSAVLIDQETIIGGGVIEKIQSTHHK